MFEISVRVVKGMLHFPDGKNWTHEMEIIVEDGGRGGVEHESNIFALQPSESSENKIISFGR